MILKQILETQKSLAETQKKESEALREFITAQNLHNQKVNSLLVSDTDAGSIGLGQQIIELRKESKENSEAINKLSTDVKKQVAYFTGFGIAGLSAAKWALTQIFK